MIVVMNDAMLAQADLSPNMRAAFEINKGTYLHRSYQIFEDNDIWKKWITSADPEAVQKGRGRARGYLWGCAQAEGS